MQRIFGSVKAQDSYQNTGFNYNYLQYHVIAVRGSIVYAKDANNTGVYKSLDNGNTWSFIATLSLSIYKGHLTSTGVLLVFLSDKSVWRSVNDGAFSAVAGLSAFAPLINGVDSNGDIICFGEYVVGHTGDLNIYKSANGGVTFASTLLKASPAEIDHFHTVKYFKEQSTWIATSGDQTTTANVWKSVNQGDTWSLLATGTKYRMVGASLIAPKTIVWGGDIGTDTFIYAGALDKLIDTTRKIGTIAGYCLGIAGNKNVLMLVTRVENAGGGVDQLNCVYCSYDAGRTWAIEHTINANPGFSGIHGPDVDGYFYLSLSGAKDVSTPNVTIRCSPMQGYKKIMAPINYEYTKRSYKFEVFKNFELRSNSGSTYGLALPFTVHNPTILIVNTLDTAIALRFTDGVSGAMCDNAGTAIQPSVAVGASKIFTIDSSILKANPIPEGFFLGCFPTGVPTTGTITMTLYGEIYEPSDHRLLE